MSIALLVSVALVAAVLSLLGAESAYAGANYQQPKVGQCRQLTGAQSRAATNSTRPIRCSASHTAQTVGVGMLSARTARSSKSKIRLVQQRTCQRLFNGYVGRSTAARAMSAFTLRVFSPTPAQKRHGARWFRCDAVLPRSGSLTPIRTTRRPLLSSPTPTNQALCQTSAGAATTCDAKHTYKATRAWSIRATAYPGAVAVRQAARSGCDSRVSTTRFRYDAPTAAEWQVGRRYVVCFSVHPVPPTPTPDPLPPTTTLVVPPGNVPVGTVVDLTGLATDDQAVAAVTLTVRNASGLYLQDDLVTFAATANTLPAPVVTAGGLGTASMSWRMRLGGSLPVGTYAVAVTVRDSEDLSVTVSDTLVMVAAPDTTRPTVSLSSPPANLTTTASLVISGAAADNVQVSQVVVQVRNSGGQYLQDNLATFGASNPDGLPVNPTGLGTSSVSFGLDAGTRAVGSYTVQVTATDGAGNVSTVLTRAVTVSAVTGASEVYFAMNEAPNAVTMTDTGSSNLNLAGVIDQDGLDTGVEVDGATGYAWLFTSPEAPPAKPERVIQVPDNAALDAGSDTFTVELRYRTSNSFGNVIQKGQSGSVGGQWKIQQPGGYPSCLFKRRTDNVDYQISTQSTVDFSVGSWHTLKCVRSGNNVTMFVDGVYNSQKNAAAGVTIGTIANNVPLTIGGKINCDQITTTCDYFTGNIDYVRLTHG